MTLESSIRTLDDFRAIWRSSSSTVLGRCVFERVWVCLTMACAVSWDSYCSLRHSTRARSLLYTRNAHMHVTHKHTRTHAHTHTHTHTNFAWFMIFRAGLQNTPPRRILLALVYVSPLQIPPRSPVPNFDPQNSAPWPVPLL